MNPIEQIVEDYKRRLKTAQKMLKKPENKEQEIRVSAKVICYSYMIIELETALAKQEQNKNELPSQEVFEKILKNEIHKNLTVVDKGDDLNHDYVVGGTDLLIKNMITLLYK